MSGVAYFAPGQGHREGDFSPPGRPGALRSGRSGQLALLGLRVGNGALVMPVKAIPSRSQPVAPTSASVPTRKRSFTVLPA